LIAKFIEGASMTCGLQIPPTLVLSSIHSC